jgi:hypothetical protein
MRQRDRKSELVEIAYRLIAQSGLEGFRIRQVSAEAGIDNGNAALPFTEQGGADPRGCRLLDGKIISIDRSLVRRTRNRQIDRKLDRAWTRDVPAFGFYIH